MLDSPMALASFISVKHASLIVWGAFWPLFGVIGTSSCLKSAYRPRTSRSRHPHFHSSFLDSTASYLLAASLGRLPSMYTTHCAVPEFFPSISSLTATFPEKQVWQFAISMMLMQRFSDAVFMHAHLRRQIALFAPTPWLFALNWAIALLHLAEYVR